jgi:hypothetical protein
MIEKTLVPLYKVFGCSHAVELGIHTEEEFIAGLECEIEEIITHPVPSPNNKWVVINDGSLRNCGFEYLSNPQKIEPLLKDFEWLHKNIKVNEKGDPFSSRTSIHVHVNISSMDAAAVRNLVLLYALYEECFFMLAKPERRDNIHCVPLSETHLSRYYKHDIVNFFKNWSKYTALNLKRMQDLGTVEFRHLHGTRDVNELSQWLYTLKNLYTLAKSVTINEKTLTDVSILKWFNTIFKDAPVVLKIQPTLFEIIRNSLIDIKLSV